LSLIKLRLKQRLLFIIRLSQLAIESDRCSRTKRALTWRLFFLSKTLHFFGATLVRLLIDAPGATGTMGKDCSSSEPPAPPGLQGKDTMRPRRRADSLLDLNPKFPSCYNPF
jgi:hypothetical protein